MRIRLFLFFLLVLVFAQQAFAKAGNCTDKDESTRPDCPHAIEFFEKLQKALHDNDRKAVAAMAHYPLRAEYGKAKSVRTKQELLAHFDEVFDAGVRCALLNAKKEDVWGNWQGFTVADGAVWFDALIPNGQKAEIKVPDSWQHYPMRLITVNHAGTHNCDAK